MKEKHLLSSFSYAFQGLFYVVKTQKHMRFHFLAAILTMIICLFFKLSAQEFLLVLFAIVFVLVTEMLNTALESMINLITTNPHPLAKITKDVAAGGVLVASVNAVIVGLVVFLPHLIVLVRRMVS
ncbi:MAG: diacylglycerol kinase [Armatimonadetes bacterium CG07_land_8_20_14_0_80_40_9]|nr:MAG: diacylglycerol kinase [Armatimonadetes bacterium CG07_land_8_20_14_0_80_40_9]